MGWKKIFSNFKVIYTCYYIILASIIGSIVSSIDGLPWLDGFFVAASNMTGAGLSSTEIPRLSAASFTFLALIMILGCPGFLLFPTLFYRRYRFQIINKRMIKQFKRTCGVLTPENLMIIKDHYFIYESLCYLTTILLFYLFFWIFFGFLFVWITLQFQPLQHELQQRGFTYADNAIFLTISAYCNSGFTITSDSLIGLDNNFYCYFILTILIIAGNTMFPIFLRKLIEGLLWLEKKFHLFSGRTKQPQQQSTRQEGHEEQEEDDEDEDEIRMNHFSHRVPYQYSFSPRVIFTFILNNPNFLLTHLFTDHQTKVLSFMAMSLIVIQFFFFLISIDQTLLHQYSLSQLIGIGYFQTLSTRAAGFAMMDLRQLNQGLTFIYGIMMYISAYPFVATLNQRNIHHEDDIPRPIHGGQEEDDEVSYYYPHHLQYRHHHTRKHQIRHIETHFNLVVKKDHRSILYDQFMKIYQYFVKNPYEQLTKSNKEGFDRAAAAAAGGLYSVSSGKKGKKSVSSPSIKSPKSNKNKNHSKKEKKTIQAEGGRVLELVELKRQRSFPSMSSLTSDQSHLQHIEIDEVHSETMTERDDFMETLEKLERNASSSPAPPLILPPISSSSLPIPPATPSLVTVTVETKKTDEEKANEAAMNPLHHNNNHTNNHRHHPPRRLSRANELPRIQEEEEDKDSLDGEDDGDDEEDEEEDKSPEAQLSRQYLFRHSFFLILTVIVLSYSEDKLLKSSANDINLWYVMFEVISAYGSVGLTFGSPGRTYSLSGAMTDVGKVVIILMMFLGKHRGLPNRKDPVIDFSFKRFQLAYLNFSLDEEDPGEGGVSQQDLMENGDGDGEWNEKKRKKKSFDVMA